MQLYLIDGQNLIPKFAGLNPSDPDDEVRLVEILQVFSRMRRQKVEVFFDGAISGQSGTHTYGVIRAHYIPKGKTAYAIGQRLEKLGPQAKETLVVSSNRSVQAETRAYHAPFLDSELFARELVSIPHSPIHPPEPPAPVKKPISSDLAKPDTKNQPNLSSDEVSEWIDLFKGKKS
jgi:predicted RNA-binding protein with PIN domain